MKESYFANLHERNLITERTTTGLLSVLPRVPIVVYDDSFCRFTRDSNGILLDKVLYQFRRDDYETLTMMASVLGLKFKPGEATTTDCLNIVIAYEMLACGALAERKLANMLWTGNPANNIEEPLYIYREFKGFELQTTGNGTDVALEDVEDALRDDLVLRNELDDIEFVIVVHPGLIYSLWSKLVERYKVDDQEYRVIFDDAIPESCEGGKFESSLYIVPLSPESTEEPVTYLEHADYQNMPVHPIIADDAFWTDDGFYVWLLEQVKWDCKLSVKNESRLVLKHPGYVTRLNVKYRLPI